MANELIQVIRSAVRGSGWVWHVYPFSVVIHYDGEFASPSNPNGAIVADRFSVYAVSVDGRKVVSAGEPFASEEEACAQASLYNSLFLIPNLDRDMEIDPVYGSSAYIRGGYEEAQMECERESAW